MRSGNVFPIVDKSKMRCAFSDTLMIFVFVGREVVINFHSQLLVNKKRIRIRASWENLLSEINNFLGGNKGIGGETD